MKKIHTKNVISVGFYRRDQWPLLLETANDRKAIEDTYDEWMLSVEKCLKKMQSSGVEPVKVDVDMNELLLWLKSRGMKNTGKARAAFIAELCREGRGKKMILTNFRDNAFILINDE